LIFASVGTARDFSRLVKEIDKAASKTKEKFIIQMGGTDYKPKHCKYFKYVENFDTYQNYMKNASVLIVHAGLGSIINSLNARKPLIIVPRRAKHNEHKNDHQMDISKQLEKDPRVIVCYNPKDLEKKIKLAKKLKVKKIKPVEKEKMFKTLKTFIDA